MLFRVIAFERKPYKKLTVKEQQEVVRFFDKLSEEILKKSSYTRYSRLDPFVQQGEKPWEIHTD